MTARVRVERLGTVGEHEVWRLKRHESLITEPSNGKQGFRAS